MNQNRSGCRVATSAAPRTRAASPNLLAEPKDATAQRVRRLADVHNVDRLEQQQNVAEQLARQAQQIAAVDARQFVENKRLRGLASLQSPPAIAQFNPQAPPKAGGAKTKLAEWSG